MSRRRARSPFHREVGAFEAAAKAHLPDLSLPLHTEMSLGDVVRVVTTLRGALTKVAAVA